MGSPRKKNADTKLNTVKNPCIKEDATNKYSNGFLMGGIESAYDGVEWHFYSEEKAQYTLKAGYASGQDGAYLSFYVSQAAIALTHDADFADMNSTNENPGWLAMIDEANLLLAADGKNITIEPEVIKTDSWDEYYTKVSSNMVGRIGGTIGRIAESHIPLMNYFVFAASDEVTLNKIIFSYSCALRPAEGDSVIEAENCTHNLTGNYKGNSFAHVHRPQTLGANARYPGSILKYHKDEAAIEKSFTIVDIEGKNLTLESRPEHYLHNVVVATGTLEEILNSPLDQNAYLFAVLKDTTTLEDPMGKLRSRYPYAAAVEYERLDGGIASIEKIDIEHQDKEELFNDFFQKQNGKAMDEGQQETIHERQFHRQRSSCQISLSIAARGLEQFRFFGLHSEFRF